MLVKQKTMEQAKTKQSRDEEGFVWPNYKGKGNRRQRKPSTSGNPESKKVWLGVEKQGEREPSEKEENKAKENQQSHNTINTHKGST
jgi:hypothetical protein